jgi:hypothetical protein
MVVLPAEQSHGRTIVGGVALTVFLGVEINNHQEKNVTLSLLASTNHMAEVRVPTVVRGKTPPIPMPHVQAACSSGAVAGRVVDAAPPRRVNPTVNRSATVWKKPTRFTGKTGWFTGFTIF